MDYDYEDDFDELAVREQNRLDRLSAIRSRLKIISNTAHVEEVHLPEPPADEPDRFQILREAREAKWVEKVPDKFKGWQLSTLPPSLRSAAIDWIRNDYPKGQNLILMGPTGVGKTSLAYSIMRELYVSSGKKMKVWQTADLMDRLRPGEDARSVMDQVKRAAVLFLDDLGAEKDTEWTEERLFLIVDHRWQYNLPTIVATNLAPDDVPGGVKLTDRLSDRIHSRLFDGAVPRILTGKDYRNG